MNNWLDFEQYRKLYHFIGKKSAKYLFFGVLTGVSLFVVEVTFAYLLQAFLVILKVVPSRVSMNFPSWMPIDNPITFLLFVATVLLIRGVLHWIHSFLSGAAYEVQRGFQRMRLVNWAFSSKSASTSEIMNLYGHGVDSVCQSLVAAQNFVILFSTSLLIFAYLLKISVLITCFSFCILALLAFITRGLDVAIVSAGKKVNEEYGEINRNLTSNLKNLLLLQIYGTQNKEKEKIKISLEKVTGYFLKYHKIMHLKSALPQTLGKILIFTLCVFSTRRAWIPSALMITYFYLFLQFVQNVSDVVKIVSGVTFSMPASVKFAKWWADHAHDGIRNRIDPDQKKNLISITEPVGWEMKKVSFSYPGIEAQVLNNFSMSVQPGTCVVLVGESGSGKSTIIALALGLIDPTSGDVCVTGSKLGVKKVTDIQSGLLGAIGYVGPESFLIEGSILDNLTYGLHHQPGEADVNEALRVADCSFVDAFPNRLNHQITEQGQGLSAGQKQRLSFARAILRKPKVLILDEATSNLDMETEIKMVQTLKRIKGSTTILAVTHREALLEIADQVLKLSSIR